MPAAGARYAGFWRRLGAAAVDTMLIVPVLIALLHLVYGRDYWRWLGGDGEGGFYGLWELVISYLLPAVFTVACWVWLQATPGKLLLGCRVVDARSLAPLRPGRAVLRYLAYFVSYLPLCLGFAWIGWDRRKQGFHDKIARSVVIRAEDAALPSLEEIDRRLA